MSRYLIDIQTAWQALPDDLENDVLGCSEAEMAELEALLPNSLTLPPAMRDYWQWAGHKAGRLYRSVDFSYATVRQLAQTDHHDIATMLKRQGDTQALPSNLLVVNEWLGDNFTFVWLGKSENPAVYWWESGQLENATQEAPTWTAWVLQRIANYKRSIQKENLI